MLNKDGFKVAHWLLIAVYLGITLISALWQSDFIMKVSPVITVLSLFSIVWLHGTTRYGSKNIIVFFLITWIVSNFFEALSIQTGFPFGHYYYDKLIGPRLFDVPLIIMFAYFAAGYSSWILSHIISGHYAKSLEGKQMIVVPVLAAFIMVMWDLCMDPLCSTVASLWVWRNGGAYFGVPLQNYFGWFMVVYIIYQVFALYLVKCTKPEGRKNDILNTRFFWLEIVAVYFILGLTQWLQYWNATSRPEIYGAMALVTVFTMTFVALLAFLKVTESKQLKG